MEYFPVLQMILLLPDFTYFLHIILLWWASNVLRKVCNWKIIQLFPS